MVNKLQKTKYKLDTAESQLSKAEAKIPIKKKKSKLQHKDQPKTKLHFEGNKPKPSEKLITKPKPSSKFCNDIKSAPKKQIVYAYHREMSKHEDDNVGVKATHDAQKATEFTGRRIKSAYQSYRRKPYKTLVKAEKSATNARINYEFEKKVAQNPNLKSNPISRFQQKQAIKKQYAKTYREGTKTTATTAKTVVKKAADTVTNTVKLMTKNPKVLLILLIGALSIFVIIGVSSSVSTLMQGGLNSIVGTSYTSEDEDILATEQNYVFLENDLQQKIDNVESDYPDYDEYRYDLAEIGHNPHELASYLTSLLQYYKADEVSDEIRRVFDLQYELTITSVTEVRYRTETRTYSWTDEEGNTYSNNYTVEVPYNYYILNVKLQNNSIDTVASNILTVEQFEMYQV